MVRSSNYPDTGLKRKNCWCFKCSTKRKNAALRGGSNRSKRKSTNPHIDGVKSNRNPKRFY